MSADLTPGQESEIAEFIVRLSDFSARKTEDCPHCKITIQYLEKIGNSVYADPCGCRIWQGEIPKVWNDKNRQTFAPSEIPHPAGD